MSNNTTSVIGYVQSQHCFYIIHKGKMPIKYGNVPVNWLAAKTLGDFLSLAAQKFGYDPVDYVDMVALSNKKECVRFYDHLSKIC